MGWKNNEQSYKIIVHVRVYIQKVVAQIKRAAAATTTTINGRLNV